MEALAEQVDAANERAEQAEQEAEYFAELMQAIAKQAKMSDDEVSELRKRAGALEGAEAERRCAAEARQCRDRDRQSLGDGSQGTGTGR